VSSQPSDCTFSHPSPEENPVLEGARSTLLFRRIPARNDRSLKLVATCLRDSWQAIESKCLIDLDMTFDPKPFNSNPFERFYAL